MARLRWPFSFQVKDEIEQKNVLDFIYLYTLSIHRYVEFLVIIIMGNVKMKIKWREKKNSKLSYIYRYEYILL
jgi:hypothetical protein